MINSIRKSNVQDQADNGTELKNINIKEILDDLKFFIQNQISIHHNKTKREMQTVVQAARSAILTQDLSENLWAEAVNQQFFLNQTRTNSLKSLFMV